MKSQTSISVLAFGLLAAFNSQLALAQTITATSAPASSVLSKISSDLSSYEASAFSALPVSQAQDLESFIDGAGVSVFGSSTADSWSAYTSEFNELITGSPDYLDNAPSDVSSILKSLATAEASIVNKDTSDALGRGQGIKVAAVVAAGLVVGVAFVL